MRLRLRLRFAASVRFSLAPLWLHERLDEPPRTRALVYLQAVGNRVVLRRLSSGLRRPVPTSHDLPNVPEPCDRLGRMVQGRAAQNSHGTFPLRQIFRK